MARGTWQAGQWLMSVSLIAWLAGCAPPAKREELVQQVLKEDPEFAQVLDKHQQLVNRIETYERELALKRGTIEHQIAQLRKELTVAIASVRQKTLDTKKRMEPDQQRLMLAISMGSEQLRAKREERASLGRSIAKLRKTLKDPNAPLTESERTTRSREIDEMLQDARRLDQELQTLSGHIRLLKIKLLLIKL